jgi:hypothetical protein
MWNRIVRAASDQDMWHRAFWGDVKVFRSSAIALGAGRVPAGSSSRATMAENAETSETVGGDVGERQAPVPRERRSEVGVSDRGPAELPQIVDRPY